MACDPTFETCGHDEIYSTKEVKWTPPSVESLAGRVTFLFYPGLSMASRYLVSEVRLKRKETRPVQPSPGITVQRYNWVLLLHS